MLKKLIVVAVAAVTTLVLLPTVDAFAHDKILASSRSAACYGIKKKGSHNEVLTVVEGKVNKKGYPAGLGMLGVANSSQCRGTGNGVSITGLTILQTQLRNASGTVLGRGPRVGSHHKSVIGSATTHHKVVCRAQLRAYMKISYSYSDHSYTTPFWVHSREFTAC